MCPIAGGNWNNGSRAGVWALNCNNARTNSNDNVGFRADSAPPHTPIGDSGAKGGLFLPAAWQAKSEYVRLSGSTVERQAGN